VKGVVFVVVQSNTGNLFRIELDEEACHRRGRNESVAKHVTLRGDDEVVDHAALAGLERRHEFPRVDVVDTQRARERPATYSRPRHTSRPTAWSPSPPGMNSTAVSASSVPR
jgi:hypothetical protein